MRLNYHRDGQSDATNPPIVLLHGLFGSYENLGTIARALYPQADVISIDLPNHGRSPHQDAFNFPQMTQSVLALLDELNIAQFAILGHSLGGKVAMQLAIDHRHRISKLIVADIAPVSYEAKHDNVLKGLSNVDLPNISNRKDADKQLAQWIVEPGVRSFLLKSLHRTDEGFAWRFNLDAVKRHYNDIRVGLTGQGQYDGPALFIKGANSDYIKAEYKADILRFFPNSKAHIVNDAGHWLHAEKPDIFNRIVQRFLFA